MSLIISAHHLYWNEVNEAFQPTLSINTTPPSFAVKIRKTSQTNPPQKLERHQEFKGSNRLS